MAENEFHMNIIETEQKKQQEGRGAKSELQVNTIMSHINDSDVTKVSCDIDKCKGTMDISVKNSNEVFCEKQRSYDGGFIKTATTFSCNMSQPERKKLVKQLRREGFKQQDIADRLGISQSQVSNLQNKP